MQLVVLHLLVETHSVGTGQKRVDKLGIAGGQIHQDRCEVGCAQGRPDALTQRAALFLISIGEVFNVFAASGVVRTQRDAAGFFNVLEGPQGAGVAQHPAGFGGAEYVGAGCFTSQAIGSGIGNEGRQLRIVHDVTNGQCDIGADDTAQNVDLVALDQLAHFTDGFVRFAVVVFYQQLHLAPAHLVIALLQHQLQTGAHAFAQGGEGAGQGCQQGNFQGTVLGAKQAGNAKQQRAGCGSQQKLATSSTGRGESHEILFSVRKPSLPGRTSQAGGCATKC